MMGNSTSYAQLVSLVENEHYAQAEEVCNAALASGQDWQFWETQLGYVCFLNEKNIQAYYDRAPAAFMSLIEKYPDDDNAHFWRAYLLDLLFSDLGTARHELRLALDLNPNNAYAKLVLSAIVDTEQSIALLQDVLKEQKTNYRAMHYLADGLIKTNRKQEAINVLEALLQSEPYVEVGYGIMNEYFNDVLTSAGWAERVREEAQVSLHAAKNSKA